MNKFFAIIIAAIMSTTYVFAISSTKCKNECMVNRFMNLNKNSDWKLIKKITLQFPSYHVQGMVKIGKYFYISSARITEKSERLKDSDYGYDRTPGKGVGYLFKFDINGKLIDKITLGIKDCYHPGGIDFDGKYIWVPVSEYRPNSRSIIYRVDPTTMKAEEIFRFGDHIGTISYNPETGILYGSSWGSRRWYAWKLKPENYLNQSKKEFNIPPYTMKLNSEHYIDYQDTHFIPGHYILCGGLNVYPIKNTGDTALKIHTEKNIGNVAFGGIDLVDTNTLEPVFQLPVNLRIAPQLVMTNNPFYFECGIKSITFYFVPQSDAVTKDNGGVDMYIYTVQ